MTSSEQIQSSSRHLSFGAEPQADKQVSCCLCNGNRQNLTSPSQWKNVDALRYIAKLNVPKGGLVCPACRKDISHEFLQTAATFLGGQSYVLEENVVCKSVPRMYLHHCTKQQVMR